MEHKNACIRTFQNAKLLQSKKEGALRDWDLSILGVKDHTKDLEIRQGVAALIPIENSLSV